MTYTFQLLATLLTIYTYGYTHDSICVHTSTYLYTYLSTMHMPMYTYFHIITHHVYIHFSDSESLKWQAFSISTTFCSSPPLPPPNCNYQFLLTYSPDRNWVQSCVSSGGSSLSFTSWSTLEATGVHIVTHRHTHGTQSWSPGFYNTHTYTHTTHCDTHTHAHTITCAHTRTHTHKDKYMHINTYKRTLTHAHKTHTCSPHFQ